MRKLSLISFVLLGIGLFGILKGSSTSTNKSIVDVQCKLSTSCTYYINGIGEISVEYDNNTYFVFRYLC